MQNVYQGLIVKTILGHDKNEVFAIIAKEGNFVYLVNGKNKTIDNPKKKNVKHLVKLGESVEIKNLISDKKLSNSYIIKCLKDYR